MKSYTDIEQSRKLAKILPLESADMCWTPFDEKWDAYLGAPNPDAIKKEIPCWSLASLLDILEHPRCFQGDKPTYWFCGCFGKDKLYHEVEADNPIDACYDMIIRLNELNLL